MHPGPPGVLPGSVMSVVSVVSVGGGRPGGKQRRRRDCRSAGKERVVGPCLPCPPWLPTLQETEKVPWGREKGVWMFH